jgi:2-keto-4-pentenoate hydratase/2-oxohepta-3-ene-1,7-dioic acid hydratase in catechol pathway
VVRIVRVAGSDGTPLEATLHDDVVRARDGRELGTTDALTLLAPCEPTKVVGVGRNYVSHLDERGQPHPTEPWVFLKTPNAVVGSGVDVARPPGADRLDYEAELALVIGRRASRLSGNDWRDHVLGITSANDLTVRAWQAGNAQWWRAKSSDGLCPIGPWIETEVDLEAPLRVRAWVDGELRQDGATDDLLFGFGEILEFVTRAVTLEPGDVVLTGSPAGAGPLEPGQTAEIEAGGVGRLTTRIVEQA